MMNGMILVPGDLSSIELTERFQPENKLIHLYDYGAG